MNSWQGGRERLRRSLDTGSNASRSGRVNQANLNPPAATSRDRLLDAAEELLAEAGFNGVSVRRIVERAAVNLGAIPYHFGTKENLFKEVVLRRAAPLREERRRLMDELVRKSPDPSLEDLLWAMLEPAFRTSRE